MSGEAPLLEVRDLSVSFRTEQGLVRAVDRVSFRIAPQEIVGKSLADAEVRRKYGIIVVSIKPRGGSFTYATPDTVVNEGDILVVAGETRRAEAFGEME